MAASKELYGEARTCASFSQPSFSGNLDLHILAFNIDLTYPRKDLASWKDQNICLEAKEGPAIRQQ